MNHITQGKWLILKDLEDIYTSLYDLFNQSYTKSGDKKFCKISMGSLSNKCSVHKNFKCIILIHKNKLKDTD